MMLKIPKQTALNLLSKQIDKGNVLLKELKACASGDKLDQVAARYDNWHNYTEEIVLKIFPTHKEKEEFSNSGLGIAIMGASFFQKQKECTDNFKGNISKLEGLVDRLDIYDEKKINSDSNNIVKKNTTNYAVFISHAKGDRLLANQFKNLLSHFDVTSFVAHDDIEKGEIWELAIIQTIKNSSIMIVIGTKEIEDSPWVNFETGLAYENMFPILFNKLSDKVSYIKNKQGVLIDYEDIEKSLVSLVSTILSKLGLASRDVGSILKSFPSIEDMKKNILNSYNTATSNKERNSISKKILEKKNELDIYFSRAIKNRYSLGEIYNSEDEDIIDLEVTMKYIDKSGIQQVKKAMFIDDKADPLWAQHQTCNILTKGERKFIPDFPRFVKTFVEIRGKGAHSGRPLNKNIEIEPFNN